MKKLYPGLVILLVLAISGCAPQMDVEAEEAAIREATVEYVNAWLAKDIERVLSLFTDDASMLPSDAPIATSKDAIRAVVSQIVENPGYALSAQATQVEVSPTGELGYNLGTYELTLNDPEGNPVTERGKWVAVWKKQPDGAWKAVAKIWNSDLPATPATE